MSNTVRGNNRSRRKNNSRPLPTSSGRITRSQLEQQQKLKSLYSDDSASHSPQQSSSKNYTTNNPEILVDIDAQQQQERVTRSRVAKENLEFNSMSPSPSLMAELSPKADDSRDDLRRGEGGGDGDDELKSAVTPSPKPVDRDNNITPGKNESVIVEDPAVRAARRAQHPQTNIMEPGPNDCLFGRGGGTNHHPGNKLYRQMVDDKKEKYLSSKRLDKPLVAMEIIHDWRALDPPGRFLKQDDVTKLWNDVGDKKAREKTSQALREKTPTKSRDDDDDNEKTARFQPGTSSPPRGRRNVKHSTLARDHSLGETYLGGGADGGGANNEISLEGFSWEETDAGGSSGQQQVAVNVNVHNQSVGGGEQHYQHHFHYHQQHHAHQPHHPPPHPGGSYPYPHHHHVREHSLTNNPLSDANVSNPATPNAFVAERPPQHPPPPYYGHHRYPGPGYGPPPPGPPGQQHPPPPPYHPNHHPQYSSPENHHPHYSYAYPQQQQQQQQPPSTQQQQQKQHRSREHSLQMNPLKGATTSQPARSDTFSGSNIAEEGISASPYDDSLRPPPLPSPTYEGGPPPPLPPPYYGDYSSGWPAPPPPPQFTYPGKNPSSSAFGRYDSPSSQIGADQRSRGGSMRSLGSSVDAFYDRQSDGNRTGAGNVVDPAMAGTSQDYSKIAELIGRDSSEKSSLKSISWDPSNNKNSAGGGDDDTAILRSKSMPYDGKSDGSTTANGSSSIAKPGSLIRKLSGGALAKSNNTDAGALQPPDGIMRPEPSRPEHVKRDTSNQPETLETKRSVKRVVLSRDQSAVARRLKDEQKTKASVSSKLSKAELLDREMSVEINKLALNNMSEDANGDDDDMAPSLNRMTTEDIMACLIDEDELGGGSRRSNLQPAPLGTINDRVTTLDAIALDIATGNDSDDDDEWDDALDLVNEPESQEGVGVNADIAEKWLKGET